jgi:hypothetical protein
MKATTIKLEGELLKELERAKSPTESLSAYVRNVLIKDLRRARLVQSAAAYQEFLEANPEEQPWLKDWDEADLSTPPQRRQR